MSRRIIRFLTLWLFVALQAMTPFIHAHAGALQLDHASFLHLHPGGPGDAACPVLAADECGAEIEVAQGAQLRIDRLGAASDARPEVALAIPRGGRAARPGGGLPTPSRPQRVAPDHTHPHALAPPAV